MLARSELRLATARWLPLSLGLLVVFGTYAILAGFYMQRGPMNSDEGFYAMAARCVMEGRLPYRDFAYTQMPLLPYLNGLAMSVTGFGLAAQRGINMLWGAVGLLTLAVALRRHLEAWEPALLAGFAVSVSPWFAFFTAYGKSYAAAGALCAGCIATLLWGGSVIRRAVVFAILGTLASGCRLHLALPVAVMALLLAMQAPNRRSRWTVLGICGAVPLLVFVPFILAAPAAFAFFNWKYHLASSFDRDWYQRLVEWWAVAPGAWVLLGAGLCGAATLWARRLWAELGLLLAGMLAVAATMIPKSAYGENAVPLAGLAAAAGVIALWRGEEMGRCAFRHVFWLLPLLVFLQPLPSTGQGGPAGASLRHYAFAVLTGRWQGWSAPERTATDVEAIGRFLRLHVAKDREVLTPITIVAVEAGRRVTPGTEMGMFSAMGPGREEEAAKLHLTTLALLTERVQARIPGAIVRIRGNANWNFRWEVPSLRWQPEEQVRRFDLAIATGYHPALEAGMYEVLLPNSSSRSSSDAVPDLGRPPRPVGQGQPTAVNGLGARRESE